MAEDKKEMETNGEPKIDPEFEALIPKLTHAEYEMLKEDISEHGCLSPIIIWDRTIVDGHNRYRICEELNIKFNTKEMTFANREEAKAWILGNQLSRRNLSLYSKFELATKQQSILDMIERGKVTKLRNLKYQASSTDLPTGGKSIQTEGLHIDVQSQLSRWLGKSKGTISKMQIIMRADKEGKIAGEIMTALRNGDITVNSVYAKIRSNSTQADGMNDKINENKIQMYVKVLNAISTWDLAAFLNNTDTKTRDEIVLKIWTARKKLNEAAMVLNYSINHPELAKKLSKGEIELAELSKLVKKRGTYSETNEDNENDKSTAAKANVAELEVKGKNTPASGKPGGGEE